jgi:flavin-dependent dehydrogenase
MRAYTDLAAKIDLRLVFDFHRELLPGYGWIFPDGEGMANIGIGLPLVEVRRRGLDIRAQLESFANRSRERGIPLGRLRRHRSHHLLAQTIPRLAYDRAVLVGGSAAMVNPMSGEGIVYAMTSAVELSQRLPLDISDSSKLNTSLIDYAKWYRDAYHKHMRLNYAISKIFAQPTIASRIIHLFHKDPKTMQIAVMLIFNTNEAHYLKWWQTRMVWRCLQTLFFR